MARFLRVFLLIITILPLACNLPFQASQPDPTQGISLDGRLLVVAPPGSTATATPFQPMAPTPTYLPTSYPTSTSLPTPEASPTATPDNGQAKTWFDYPGPTVWPDIQIPEPVGILPQPEGQVNILLLGSDQRPYEGGFRTDTIMLLTLNPANGTANLTSFPRDLYVYIPGWTVHRINTAFGFGGFNALMLTMEYNFGVHPDYYILINLWTFPSIIDNLGGINVQVAQALCDHRDGYGNYCVSPGSVRMDGETALWYVRSRYSTSDFDRTRRQQEVVRAGFNRLLSLNALTRADELYQAYKTSVSTDIGFDAIAGLLPLAAELATDSTRIQQFYIGPQQVIPWVNYNGSQVLLPVREAVLQVMKQALNSPP
jgi:LCP family protein required for cell wall assembly